MLGQRCTFINRQHNYNSPAEEKTFWQNLAMWSIVFFIVQNYYIDSELLGPSQRMPNADAELAGGNVLYGYRRC